MADSGTYNSVSQTYVFILAKIFLDKFLSYPLHKMKIFSEESFHFHGNKYAISFIRTFNNLYQT